MHFYSFWLHFSLLRNLGQEELVLKLNMWHEMKQTNQDCPPSPKSNKQWSLLSLTSGFDFFFFFFFLICRHGMNYHDTKHLWWCSKLTELQGTRFFSYKLCSCGFAIKKYQSVSAFNLRLYVWEELLMLLGQSIAATQLTGVLQMERFS